MNGCRKCTKHYHNFVKTLKTINFESQCFQMVCGKAFDKKMNLSGCNKCDIYPLRSAYENHVRCLIHYKNKMEYYEAMGYVTDELENLKSNGINIIKFLIKNGADLCQVDRYGRNIFDVYFDTRLSKPMSQDLWQLINNYYEEVRLDRLIKSESSDPQSFLIF